MNNYDLGLPKENPINDLYADTELRTLTGYLARLYFSTADMQTRLASIHSGLLYNCPCHGKAVTKYLKCLSEINSINKAFDTFRHTIIDFYHEVKKNG